MFEKHKPGRSEAYLDYIRSQRCYICQRSPSEPHHVETGGMGMKGSDFSALPLCREHHREIHDMGKARFWRQYFVAQSWGIHKYLVEWCDRHYSEEALTNEQDTMD